jgi:hypothetical protein
MRISNSATIRNVLYTRSMAHFKPTFYQYGDSKMQKLRHRLFSASLTRPQTFFIIPHVLQPCIKVVHDSVELLFPKNIEQSWQPTTDMVYFKETEIAMWNNIEHCQNVNRIFKTAAELANAGQNAKACSLLAESIAHCNEENNKLNEDMAQLAEGYAKGKDRDGGMGYIGAMIGVNDQMSPNDLAIISAQIYRTFLNKDYQAYRELEPKLIESLNNHLEIYIAASEHYDEQFLSKIIFILVDILHYNNYLDHINLSENTKRLMSKIECTYHSHSNLHWSQIALKFHYAFYYYQAHLPQNALDQLKNLEDDLFSLKFSNDNQITEKNNQLLRGSYVYNKCQLADLGFTEKKELLNYAKNLLSHGLDNNEGLLREIFSDHEHALRI